MHQTRKHRNHPLEFLFIFTLQKILHFICYIAQECVLRVCDLDLLRSLWLTRRENPYRSVSPFSEPLERRVLVMVISFLHRSEAASLQQYNCTHPRSASRRRLPGHRDSPPRCVCEGFLAGGRGYEFLGDLLAGVAVLLVEHALTSPERSCLRKELRMLR